MATKDKKQKSAKTEPKTTVFGIGTIGERGQIIIPIKLRKSQNIKPGDTFVFTGNPESNHFYVINANTFKGFTDDLQALLSGKEDPSDKDK